MKPGRKVHVRCSYRALALSITVANFERNNVSVLPRYNSRRPGAARTRVQVIARSGGVAIYTTAQKYPDTCLFSTTCILFRKLRIKSNYDDFILRSHHMAGIISFCTFQFFINVWITVVCSLSQSNFLLDECRTKRQTFVNTIKEMFKYNKYLILDIFEYYVHYY